MTREIPRLGWPTKKGVESFAGQVAGHARQARQLRCPPALAAYAQAYARERMLQKSRAGKKQQRKSNFKNISFRFSANSVQAKLSNIKCILHFTNSKACSTRFFVTRKTEEKVAVYKLYNSQIAEDGVFVTD